MPDDDGDVVASIRDTDPTKAPVSDLQAEYQDITSHLYNWTGVSPDGHRKAVERLGLLYDQLRTRLDVEYPECDTCGSREWEQHPNEPVTCSSCGQSPTEQTREKLWAAHTALVEGADEAKP